MKIVIFSDLHYAADGSMLAGRQSSLSDILLLRTVHRINRYIQPDLAVFCGDMTDSPGDTESLKKLSEILGKLSVPFIAIPGNHDPDPETFYQIIPKPAEHLDIKGFRFIPASDEMRPGWNARRHPDEIQRCKNLAESFEGRSILIQHVPLYLPGTADCPYRIENAEEILSGPFSGAISGHWHAGFQTVQNNGFFAVCAPALCEPPFIYTILNLDESTGKATVEQEQLQLPPGYIDTHIHTCNANCQENMDTDRSIAFTRVFGLKNFAFTEHSGQLYVSGQDYWSGAAQRQGLDGTPRQDRSKDYFNLLDQYGKDNTFIRGFELDVDAKGNLMVDPADLLKVDLRIGAVHWVSGEAQSEAMYQDFMFRTEALLQKGCHILAHPFRIFQRSQIPAPEFLYLPVIELLKKYHAAAEINFHTNWPETEFFRMCLENNVKIALGSDSHNLYEIGEFYAHLKLLESIGATQEHLFYPDFN